MDRFPLNRLRVEFDGPDVSQEMLYTLFRVCLLARVQLRTAIWETRGYTYIFTRPGWGTALCFRRVLEDLTGSYGYQLRECIGATKLTASYTGTRHR